MHGSIIDVLRRKGTEVFSVSPFATVEQAVTEMNRAQCGCVLVLEDGVLLGIFTERDVLRRVIARNREPAQTLVADVMTLAPITIRPHDEVVDAMRLMSQRRCRHLPVTDGQRLLGMISIGDLNQRVISDLEEEVQSLSQYIGSAHPI